METLRAFLTTHAYTVIALTVLADQTGLPVPAAPFLLAAGALARSTGEPDLALLLILSSVASVCGHSFWYFAGRRKGTAMLKQVCKLSFEPEACVRRSQDMFARFGPMTLLVVRFIPGVDTMAQPLVGVAGMPVGQYLGLTVVGAVMWSGVLLGIGYGFGTAAAQQHLMHGFKVVLVFLGAALLGYAVWKILRRHKQLGRLNLPRMAVEDLKKRLDAGEKLVVIDMRHTLEARFHPYTIPGAKRFSRNEAASYVKSLPEDQDVVVFCNCPREAGSVSFAHSVTMGTTRHVWPLEGGLDDWQEHNFPTQPLPHSPPTDSRSIDR